VSETNSWFGQLTTPSGGHPEHSRRTLSIRRYSTDIAKSLPYFVILTK
jgi:hypothetical protein